MCPDFIPLNLDSPSLTTFMDFFFYLICVLLECNWILFFTSSLQTFLLFFCSRFVKSQFAWLNVSGCLSCACHHFCSIITAGTSRHMLLCSYPGETLKQTCYELSVQADLISCGLTTSMWPLLVKIPQMFSTIAPLSTMNLQLFS